MAHAATFDTGHAGTGPVAGLLARVRKALADRAAYRRTLDELSTLSDRDLRDLGLRRPDLDGVARAAVYGR